jgi:hypothetical protein
LMVFTTRHIVHLRYTMRPFLESRNVAVV